MTKVTKNKAKPKLEKVKFILVIVAAVIVAFSVGLLMFNFVIMPWLVRQGQEGRVPDVVGKHINEAKKIILQRGFHIGEVNEIFDTIFPLDYVSSQKPKGGAVAKIGRIVTLVVSKGQKRVKIPLVGKSTLDQARSIIENLGLRIGAVETMPSNLIPAGRVITTYPEPGSDFELGNLIKIQLSSGPPSPLTVMPNLVGLTLNLALDTIQSRNLSLGEIRTIESDEKDGMIIIQYPEEGMKLGPADTVRLIVAKKRDKPEPSKK